MNILLAVAIQKRHALATGDFRSLDFWFCVLPLALLVGTALCTVRGYSLTPDEPERFASELKGKTKAAQYLDSKHTIKVTNDEKHEERSKRQRKDARRAALSRLSCFC